MRKLLQQSIKYFNESFANIPLIFQLASFINLFSRKYFKCLTLVKFFLISVNKNKEYYLFEKLWSFNTWTQVFSFLFNGRHLRHLMSTIGREEKDSFLFSAFGASKINRGKTKSHLGKKKKTKNQMRWPAHFVKKCLKRLLFIYVWHKYNIKSNNTWNTVFTFGPLTARWVLSCWSIYREEQESWWKD